MATIGISNPLWASEHTLGRITTIASSCTINILSLALPIATLQIYDRVLHGQNESTLHVLILGVVLALITETLLRIIRSYIICHNGAVYAHHVTCAALNQQLDARVAHGESRAVATQLAGLGAVKGIKDFHNGYSSVVFVDLLFLPLFIGVIAYISKELVLIPVALLCAFGLIVALNGLKVRRHMIEGGTEDEKRNDFIIETLMSSQFAKSYDLEKLLQRRFERLHTTSCASSYHTSLAVNESVVFSTVLGHLMTPIIVAAGAYMVIDGRLTVGALIAVVQLSSRLMRPVQQGVLLWVRFHGYQAAKAKVERLFDLPLNYDAAASQSPDTSGRLDIERVTFRAQPNLPLTFEDVSFSVEKGQTIVLDGPTGSGKSVLLKMIAGIYTPTSGRINIGGADLRDMPSSTIARHVAYLAPRSTLLRGTIRDNITCFGEIPLSQVMPLAKYLGMKSEFDRLAMGIDTVVGGEQDANISPGLVQMISLLRALSSKPRLILFDNADDGVDTSYYNSLYALLGRIKPNIAMIIVSRDMNIRQLADRRMILSDGRIVETGMEFAPKIIRTPGL